MRHKHFFFLLLAIMAVVVAQALVGNGMMRQPMVSAAQDTVPRKGVKKTVATELKDLQQSTSDLRTPENLKEEAVYNAEANHYEIGTKLGDSYLNTPFLMSPEEYQAWSLQKSLQSYFRQKNEEEYKNKGKEAFTLSDMKFDLGPAEKIFGPGGVRVRTQGSIELKIGANMQNVDNPSLPINRRRTFGFDFDEKINLNLTGSVGDKMNMNLNYNTEATFDFDTKNIKLRYEGKEDEIIKLVEAGNVSLPTNSSLIRGASSLFGLRTDMQFGKLKLQTVVSQKKTSTKTVSSKGGKNLSTFEFSADNYEANRHFFLGHFFRNRYDATMAQLPNITSGVTLGRVEIWVTNNSGTTTDTRNIIALTDLGEYDNISNTLWTQGSVAYPSNQANTLYSTLTTSYDAARNINSTTQVLGSITGFIGGVDFEKLESARKLNNSEYTINQALGYVSLKSTLQADQVLAVAYEYTFRGVTYQVGEFSTDQTDNTNALFVKSLKNTSNTPEMGNWDLMMKNVYALGALSVQKDQFKLNIKYLSDTTGVYLNYINEPSLKDTPLIRLLGLDRIDDNNNPNPNGVYDYIDGYTIDSGSGRVIFSTTEPFGTALATAINNPTIAAKYTFTSLYDSLKTVAQQDAEKDKFIIVGQYKGSSGSEIDLGATNIPRGSVVVTANGVTLTENSDYSVDYNMGRVTIINQSIIDAGTNVSVSLESESDFSLQRKTMLGLNWQYDYSKALTFGGTFMHLSEQPLISKVSMGSEALNNTLWGVNLAWKQQSQWLTDMLDRLPFVNASAPSHISLTAEFAHLIAGKNQSSQNDASYLDDFENTNTKISVSTPTEWIISSTPALFPESAYTNDIRYGYNRALLSWYYIDPILTRRNSSLTPGHLKSDLAQQSNHYVREVYKRELFPNTQTTYGEPATLSVLNMAYYPADRGPYNLDPDLTSEGKLSNPQARWGGMMRKIETTDFETSNIEYIEFWMLDPFIYTRNSGGNYGGDLYFNLGEISEDVLHDGQKFSESDMPQTGDATQTTATAWGRVPTQKGVTYAFNTASNSRQNQDVGYNGLRSEEEKNFTPYTNYLTAIRSRVAANVYDSIAQDPAGDDYHYFRGSDYDNQGLSILDRYKRINMPEGNSVDSENSPEKYSTSYKSTPDVEDINSDYTLNEYEQYYQYKVSIHPDSLVVGKNYIVDSHSTSVTLRNNTTEPVTWYLFRIPVDEYHSKVGNIQDFSNVRFMRMFMTGFENPIVLRMATLDLVRGEWRTYTKSLNVGASASTGSLVASAVSYEENSSKKPVNYVLPPGITREVDPSQSQLQEENEAALSLIAKDLSSNEARAVYKKTNLDLRNYKRLKMFAHANALPERTDLADKQVSVFIRLGSDYTNNYYEYEIPLTVTPTGEYNPRTLAGSVAVWPEANNLDIPLSLLTEVKKQRNRSKSTGQATYTEAFSIYDPNAPNNKVTIMGNPSLGEVKTMMVGVRNNTSTLKSAEVWVNELRLQEFTNDGGWAAQGNLNMQLSDIGTVNLAGQIETAGFGGLEDNISARRQEDYVRYGVTASFELGRFLPSKLKLQAPVYYAYSKEKTSPLYNPLDTDMKLSDALDALTTDRERDSLRHLTTTNIVNRNFSISNARFNISTKGTPMPYDPANFTFGYAHSHQRTTGEVTAWETEDSWKWTFGYNYAPNIKGFAPFKNIKSKKRGSRFLKELEFNFLPQSISFNTDLNRHYYELQERNIDNLENTTEIPLVYSSTFLWNRNFALRWDLTKDIKMNFTSTTNAEIEMPYTAVNKDLYPDRYTAWKDSVWHSIMRLGTPLAYRQTFNASYKLPINHIPLLNWVSSDISYTSTYTWTRGYSYKDGSTLGNTIANSRDINGNVKLNLETLYNFVPFLKKTNARFASSHNSNTKKTESKPFEKEIQLLKDTTQVLIHNQRNKRIKVRAIAVDGTRYAIRYKVLDANRINILSKDTAKIKVTVIPDKPIEERSWYKAAQSISRTLMMVRNIDINYQNNYNLSLPGFLPNIGDAFGQRSLNGLQPGLGFAFGFTDDKFIQKAIDQNWLLISDTISTPATSNVTENLRISATLQPFRDFNISLNANRVVNKAKTIQYMYEGMPTTQNGSFTMTTISLGTAFQGMGNVNTGYHSKAFMKFVSLLEGYRSRFEAQFAGAPYPTNSTLAGRTFDPANGTVNQYSADVMIPAFLAAYTSGAGSSLDLFPTLGRLLPNWTLSYAGLAKLSFMKKTFKSFNINHSYKSIYTVGSYGTYASYNEYMNGLGFVTDAKSGNPVPSSMYDISTVSINESFSPLLGVDMTFNNNMTAKLEYRKTRVLSLSMTSYQLTETGSDDIVVGLGYKINDIKLFSDGTRKRTSRTKSKKVGESSTSATAMSSGFKNSLTLQLDFSLRDQNTINRDIAALTSTATSGNKALRISFMANYVLSKLMTLSAYYERQQNSPLLTSSSYPTTTQDFGISFKFSLTR